MIWYNHAGTYFKLNPEDGNMLKALTQKIEDENTLFPRTTVPYPFDQLADASISRHKYIFTPPSTRHDLLAPDADLDAPFDLVTSRTMTAEETATKWNSRRCALTTEGYPGYPVFPERIPLPKPKSVNYPHLYTETEIKMGHMFAFLGQNYFADPQNRRNRELKTGQAVFSAFVEAPGTFHLWNKGNSPYGPGYVGDGAHDDEEG